jgi:hypothetical protein
MAFPTELAGGEIARLPAARVNGLGGKRSLRYDRAMDRVLSICESFEAAERLDLAQWAALSGRERILAGEALRDEWAERDGESGLQRILRLAERSEG